jgi:sulfur-oxidizing protein SoxX
VPWFGWVAALGVAGCATATPNPVASYKIVGDAIREPLSSAAGDPARGREVMLGRDGNCLLCHAAPETGVRFMGNLAPTLSGVGAKLNAGQLRLRIVDSMHLNRDTIMPSYYRTDGYSQVAEAWRGKPILTAQQVEDTIAYLLTLR